MTDKFNHKTNIKLNKTQSYRLLEIISISPKIGASLYFMKWYPRGHCRVEGWSGVCYIIFLMIASNIKIHYGHQWDYEVLK